MARLTVNFYDNRTFSDRAITPALKFTVKSLSRDNEGGEKEAKIAVQGIELDLWSMLDLLSMPARIYSYGTCCWIGYVHSVKITTSRGLVFTASMDQVFNRIKVVYSELGDGDSYTSEKSETAWYEDTNSSAYYGDKEKKINLAEASDSFAIAAAQQYLSDFSLPHADRNISGLGTYVEPSGEIILHGLFETLDWIYYDQTAGKESYENIGTGVQNLGDVSDNTKVAQSFQLGSTVTWTAIKILIRCNKEGAPTDNLTVELCSDSAGAPGTVLASATLAGASTPDYLNWVTLTLSANVTLALSTTYWIQASRSGAVDATNYFKVDANEELGYSRGSFKIYNGATWAARSPDADMLFSLIGESETTQQLSQIISACGQFITNGTRLDVNSGVYTSPYRDGSATGLTIARELLRKGTSNSRRMRAGVHFDNFIYIDEEPTAWSQTYYIDEKGKLYGFYMEEILPEFMPAGVYLELKHIIPNQVNLGMIANPVRAFVEEVTYNAENDRVLWKFRGSVGILSLSGAE